MKITPTYITLKDGTLLMALPDGSVYTPKKQSMAGLGLGPMDYENAIPEDSAQKKFDWDKLFTTVDKVLSSDAVKNIFSNVSFDSGQFQFGPGGVSTPPPPPAPAGFNWKPFALIGGAVGAAALIAYLTKPKKKAA